jgi:hypothetical protein
LIALFPVVSIPFLGEITWTQSPVLIKLLLFSISHNWILCSSASLYSHSVLRIKPICVTLICGWQYVNNLSLTLFVNKCHFLKKFKLFKMSFK